MWDKSPSLVFCPCYFSSSTIDKSKISSLLAWTPFLLTFSLHSLLTPFLRGLLYNIANHALDSIYYICLWSFHVMGFLFTLPLFPRTPLRLTSLMLFLLRGIFVQWPTPSLHILASFYFMWLSFSELAPYCSHGFLLGCLAVSSHIVVDYSC